MISKKFYKGLLIAFFFACVISGVVFGAFNQQAVRDCYSEYENQPEVDVDCVDGMVLNFDFISIGTISIGIFGLATIIIKDRNRIL